MTDYPRPSVTVDVAVVRVRMHEPELLLIRRGADPFAGRWALPGGYCEPKETVEQAAERELEEETGLRGVTVEQVRAFSEPGRDPRGWTISIAHLAVVPAGRSVHAVGGDDASDAAWWAINADASQPHGVRLTKDGKAAGPLAFDHDAIIGVCLEELAARWARLGDMLAPKSDVDTRRAVERALGLAR